MDDETYENYVRACCLAQHHRNHGSLYSQYTSEVLAQYPELGPVLVVAWRDTSGTTYRCACGEENWVEDYSTSKPCSRCSRVYSFNGTLGDAWHHAVGY